jgi:hypothetical protein
MKPLQDIRVAAAKPRGALASSFRHEHVLWINEPGNPLIPPVARSRLWAGLVHTIRMPAAIDQSIDESRLVETSEWLWHRRSLRGETVVADRIDLTPETSITVTIEEGPFAGSRSEIRIEEPGPGALLVRIVHEVKGPTVALSPEEQKARKTAYDTMNVERICCARSVANGGTRDPRPLNG